MTLSKPSISLIIPTYGREQQLLRLLINVQLQHFQDIEVLVVDNAVTPTLKIAIEDFNREANIPVRYVTEQERGLHHARHRGVKEARSDLLAFVDDDVTLAPQWASAYVNAFHTHTEMAAAGGPVRPRWAEDPPEWLSALLSKSGVFYPLSLMDLGDEFHLSSEGFFFGANMAIRRSALFDVGGFHPDAGVPGLRGDGETGLYRKLAAEGALIGYVPEALVFHWIPRGRTTLSYLLRRVKDEGRSDTFSKFNRKNPTPWSLTCSALASIANAPL